MTFRRPLDVRLGLVDENLFVSYCIGVQDVGFCLCMLFLMFTESLYCINYLLLSLCFPVLAISHLYFFIVIINILTMPTFMYIIAYLSLVKLTEIHVKSLWLYIFVQGHLWSICKPEIVHLKSVRYTFMGTVANFWCFSLVNLWNTEKFI